MHTGDQWTLRVNGNDFHYTVGAPISNFSGSLTSIEAVAAGLTQALGGRYGASASNDTISLTDTTNGFRIDAVTESVPVAGTVTRKSGKLDGTASDIKFTSADIALAGTPGAGRGMETDVEWDAV